MSWVISKENSCVFLGRFILLEKAEFRTLACFLLTAPTCVFHDDLRSCARIISIDLTFLTTICQSDTSGPFLTESFRARLANPWIVIRR